MVSDIKGRRNLSALHKQRISLLDVMDTNKMKNAPEYKEASKIHDFIEGSSKRLPDSDSDKLEEENNLMQPEMMDKETNVGKKLSDLTTKRVVIIVLLIMITIPIFSSETYIDKLSVHNYGLEEIINLYENQKEITEEF